jgi:uncharacterized protein
MYSIDKGICVYHNPTIANFTTMFKTVILSLSPKQALENQDFTALVSRKLNLSRSHIRDIIIEKKSIDARQKQIRINFRLQVYLDQPAPAAENILLRYQRKTTNRRVLIAGAGPAGLFAALKLIEMGLKPVIIERGKEVKARKIDIAAMSRPATAQFINIDSNYCFGEGGAGTFSDGKLYTRSSKRGDVSSILNILIAHGAHPEIAYDAHPHIGSDKLPVIITKMRNTILDAGGEIHFNCRITDFIIKDNQMHGVLTKNGLEFTGEAMVLATGHSAHDIYELLHTKNILLEAKPFAMGIRIEHPQELIDNIQYKSDGRGAFLPAAYYQLVTQQNGKGVFSFCMCPGGIIVPSATQSGEVVVNGMSNSRRNSPYANSGIAVAIDPSELTNFQQYGPLSGLRYQQWVERSCFEAANKSQQVPGQRMTDFCAGKLSKTLKPTSYNPGVVNAELHHILPPEIVPYLQGGFKDFDRKMKGFMTDEAMLLAPESRTSSAVRIPRNADTLEHLQIQRLFPCGEGAGYAGGIVSSAIDGENVAKAVAKALNA